MNAFFEIWYSEDYIIWVFLFKVAVKILLLEKKAPLMDARVLTVSSGWDIIWSFFLKLLLFCAKKQKSR